MSIFCQDLPTFSKTGGTTKQPITIFLKPCADKEYYQFRLLNFRNPNNSRDNAFIRRWVHTHWGKNDQGKNIVDDTVVCLTTTYVPFEESNTLKARREACPMCRHDDESFGVWKNSGWKDKIAMKRHFSMQRQFQGIIPVYVVKDPFNDKNNGKLKCFIISNPKEYEAFDKLVHEKLAMINHLKRTSPATAFELFNGTNAVDFYLKMEKVPEVRNEGKPNETTVEVRKITKMVFGKQPYDIPEITEELVQAFEFDDQYYTESTPEEIEAFYKKHYSVVTQNVPNEDIDSLFDEDAPRTPAKAIQSAALKEISKPAEDPLATPPDVDMEDLLGEVEPDKPKAVLVGDGNPGADEELPESSPEEEETISGDDVESLLSDLDSMG